MFRKKIGQNRRFGSNHRVSDHRRVSVNRSHSYSGKRSGSGKRQFNDMSKFINRITSNEDIKPYKTVNDFADFEIDNRLKKNILDAGFIHPTPIQDQAIPHILKGSDIVGIADTGTGKTAAFLVPLLNNVLKDKKQKVLVVAPTRDLAVQINQVFMKLASDMHIFSVCTVGGIPVFRQVNEMRRSYNFIIGTPGRIKDLIERRRLQLNDFQTIVLDEADRMLDMGFINDMRFLISAMPDKHQTLFFSATLSRDVKLVINDFLNDPINIFVKTRDTARGVDQDVIHAKKGAKLDMLNKMLVQPEFKKVLIFGRTKIGVEHLYESLSNHGIKARSIHGDKNYSQRQNALKMFKNSSINVLVATDVAARGIDIPNVSHVINYELPATYEDYIHRIGRTGRAGKTGKALTFVE